MRVLRKIKEGEEITLAYTWKWAREERRAELENYFNFNCRCEACDISEEEILEEKEITEKFEDEQVTHERLKKATSSSSSVGLHLKLLREQVECMKRSYRF